MPGPVVATKVRIPNMPSMPLERLDRRLDGVWQHQLAIVVAPAGSGKTTLLARLAARAPGPVGWYRAEGWDSDVEALLRHVEAALVPGAEGLAGGWSTVEEAANALEAWNGPPLLLIVDDLHTLQGTPAEAALERLIDYAPSSLRVAIGSRVQPGFNISRLRVSGGLLELTSDDLRFRSWEVERLFRDFYSEPLPPEELARLARRTEGWAAGLQLFHLATRGRTADERRRMLAELNGTARLAREYLARNVLHQLPDDLRRFLLDTSVLGRLSGPLCDLLLSRTGSSEMLAELERRRLFTQSLQDDGVYRYHEILRTHLLAALAEELGEDGLCARFSAAARLLAEAGAVSEALEAYCRGEDWEGARQLLDGRGELVADGPGAWLEVLPGPLVQNDPWLLLASARRMRAEGRLREAVERYRRAEIAFGRAEAAERCRDERAQTSAWVDAAESHGGPFGVLRAALQRDPLAAVRSAQRIPGAAGPLVGGLSSLVAGHVAAARRELIHVAERTDASRPTVVIASLGAGAAGALMGQPHAALELDSAAAAAEGAGLEWLARIGRAAMALTGSIELVGEAEVVAQTAAATGDEWGAAVARLCRAMGALRAGQDVTDADQTVVQLRRLGAPVLEAWMRAIVALAGVRAGEPEARQDAIAADAVAQSVGVDGARVIANLAVAESAADPIEAEDQRALALALAQETGIHVPSEFAGPADSAESWAGSTGSAPPMSIRLLGGFHLAIDGREVDLSEVRPRARTLLRLLALHAGKRVHHETIEDALWPDADAAASARNLHVAIAALRRMIEPTAGRGSFQLLRREGDAYVMAAPPGSEIDVERFEQLISAANHACQLGDRDAATGFYQQALDTYRGDLLPEDGPVDWVTERREALRLAAVEATQALAEILLARGEAARAARAASAGLQIERYHDPLWRLLISARDQAGDLGAARAARLGYDRMLAELGLQPGATGSSPL